MSEAYLDTDIAAPAFGRPAWYRSIGAFLLWFLLHSLSLLPREVVDMLVAAVRRTPVVPSATPGVLQGGALVPLMPPLVGLLYNVLLAATFVWWFAGRHDDEADYRRAMFQLRRMPASVIGRLPLVALPLVATVFLSLIVVPRFIPFPPQKTDPLEAFLKLRFGLLAVLSIVSLVVPLVEEFLFRGWLQSTLRRWLPAPQAILLTALVFGVAHFQTFGLPIRVVFGLAAGYLAWSTRSIWPGVVLHGLYNAVLVGGGEAIPGIDDAVLTRWAHTPSIFFPAVGAFAVSALLLVAALRVVARAAQVEPTPAAG